MYHMVACGVILTVFHAAVASSNPQSEGPSTAFFVVGMVAGGYIENLVLSVMVLVWEPNDIGLVSGVLCAIQTAGGALASSMYSSILATQLNTNLPKYMGPAGLQACLPKTSLPAFPEGSAAGSFNYIPGVSPQILAAIVDPLKEAYTLSLRTVWLSTLAFGCITIFAAFFTPNMEE